MKGLSLLSLAARGLGELSSTLSSGDNEKSQPGKAGFQFVDRSGYLPDVSLDVRLEDIRIDPVLSTEVEQIHYRRGDNTRVQLSEMDLTDTFIPVMGVDDDTFDPFLGDDELTEVILVKNIVRDGIEVVPTFTADPDKNLC